MKHLTTKSLIISLSIFFGLSSFIFPQVTTEQLYHGAHSMALAGSNVAHQTDAWAAFANPAGLTRVNGMTAAVAYEENLGQKFLPHSQMTAAMPIGKFGVAGLSLDRLAVSYAGNTLTTELAIGFQHGFFLQQDQNSSLAFGYSLKYLQLDFGKSAGSAGDGSDGIDLGQSRTLGVDIGFLASLRDRHWVGVRVMNFNRPDLGQTDNAVDLPRSVQVGVGYSPYDLVWTTFAMTKSAGHVSQYSAGMEYEILKGLKILSGVQSNPNRLGLGLRLELQKFVVDYALMTHPVLPLSHQMSLGMSL
ncbi:MAG: type IX secretion system membrane protein PorP/SprF [Candidatus Marinimicrobia bacterium]|nr:type IX secretion system membrane protein PorP/SprF [Candidatus Neomarinimicrobiota bacterium]